MRLGSLTVTTVVLGLGPEDGSTTEAREGSDKGYGNAGRIEGSLSEADEDNNGKQSSDRKDQCGQCLLGHNGLSWFKRMGMKEGGARSAPLTCALGQSSQNCRPARDTQPPLTMAGVMTTVPVGFTSMREPVEVED